MLTKSNRGAKGLVIVRSRMTVTHFKVVEEAYRICFSRRFGGVWPQNHRWMFFGFMPQNPVRVLAETEGGTWPQNLVWASKPDWASRIYIYMISTFLNVNQLWPEFTESKWNCERQVRYAVATHCVRPVRIEKMSSCLRLCGHICNWHLIIFLDNGINIRLHPRLKVRNQTN
jgi:hypothetical protein